MKKSIVFCFIALISISVFGQDSRRTSNRRTSKEVKKTTAPKKKDEKDSISIMTMPVIVSKVAIATPIQKTYKLKITLTDVQCIASSDSDEIDDYGIQQHIYYKANGKIKRPISKDIRKFKDNCDDRIDNGNMYISGGDNVHGKAIKDIVWEGANGLVCGDHKNQLHVKQGRSKRSLNVNNSMTFLITQAEYDDKNAEMIINTTVTEYNSTLDRNAMLFGSNNNRTYNYDGKKVHVSIRDVLDALTGIRPLKTTKPFFDTTIASGMKFDNFEGFKLPLTKVDYDRKTILEGVLRARGATPANKAAIWLRFELVD